MEGQAVTGNLQFNDGFQKVTINQDSNRIISWNPNDVGFVDRYLGFMEWVEKDFRPRVMGLKIDKDKGLDDYQQGDISKLGEELNAAIDECFKSPVAEAAFVGVNPLSPMANGNLLFMNFFEALMPIIQKSVKDFEGARKKYTTAAKRSRGDTVPIPSAKK